MLHRFSGPGMQFHCLINSTFSLNLKNVSFNIVSAWKILGKTLIAVKENIIFQAA